MLNIIGISLLSFAIAMEFGIIVLTEEGIREKELRQMYQRLGLE